MTEKLLHFLWNFRIFKSFDFKDSEGNAVEILDFGKWNSDAGPDFSFGKIKFKNLIHAGHIEFHLRSSDWILHGHDDDAAYDNVILHVVFEHDLEIESLVKKNIPTLEIKHYLDSEILKKYSQIEGQFEFIPCEKIFDAEKVPFGFAHQSLLNKLNAKAEQIKHRLAKTKNDYEAVLFQELAYAFGLKINAEIFRQIAENIPFSVLKKIRQNLTQTEALLFGKAGWLENPEDEQSKIWKKEFDFIKAKHQIPEQTISPKFLRLRPPNFPTIRLSQLAALYHREQNLFSKIIFAQDSKAIHAIFQGIKAGDYWNTHFNFGKESKSSTEKNLTKDFIDLIILNAVLPLKYAYHKNHDEETADKILEFYEKIKPEQNSVIENWQKIGAKIENAKDSQAFIYHYKTNCETKNCLNCGIGLKILKA